MNAEIQAPEKNPWIHHFCFEGKSYRLFKKKKNADAPWYLYFERKKTRYLRSLDTNLKTNAIANAKIIIAAVKAENWNIVEQTKLLSARSPSLREIIQAYQSAPLEVKSATRHRNALCLRLVVRKALGLPEGADVDSQPSSILTGELIRKFKGATLSALEDSDDDAADLRAKTSANSLLRQARSLFAAQARSIYRDANLTLPDLAAFMEEPYFAKTTKYEYNPPDDTLIAKTFTALDTLRHTNLDMYFAICFAVGAGLRKGEIAKARWNWFLQRDGQAFIRGDVIGKNQKIVDVPILAEWWARIMACRPALEIADHADTFILSGTKTDRTETVFRDIGHWMNELGWQTQKKIHEFRAYVGSKIGEKHGIRAAQVFLRHASVATTEKFYMRYLKTKNFDVKLGSA